MPKQFKNENRKLQKRLERFVKINRVQGKGALSLMLVISDKVSSKPVFPLHEDDFLTKRRGQVSGASRAAFQN